MEPGAGAHHSLSGVWSTNEYFYPPNRPPLDGMWVHRKVTPTLFSGMSPVLKNDNAHYRARTHRFSGKLDSNIDCLRSLFFTTGGRKSQTSRSNLSCQRNNATTTLETGPTDPKIETLGRAPRLHVLKSQAPVVQTLDSDIHQINYYPVEK